MFTVSTQDKSALRDSIKANCESSIGFQRSSYPTISPLLRIPAIDPSDAYFIASEWVVAASEIIEDDRALSKWLLTCGTFGWLSLEEINTRDFLDLVRHSLSGIKALNHSIVWNQQDALAEVNALCCWSHINQQLWSCYGLFGLEKEWLYERELEECLADLTLERCANIVSVVDVGLNQLFKQALLSMTDDPWFAPDFTISLDYEAEDGGLKIENSDFYVFDIDHFIDSKDEVARLIKSSFNIISSLFVPVMLPSDLADMYLEGWCYKQETITALEDNGILKEDSDLFDVIEHLTENTDEYEYDFDLDETFLSEAIDFRKRLKADINAWKSDLDYSSESCMAFINELDGYLQDEDLSSDIRLSWLAKFVYACRTVFPTVEEMDLFRSFRTGYAEFVSDACVICNDSKETYDEDCVQVLYEGFMNDADGKYLTVSVNSKDIMLMVEKLMICLGMGFGLISSALLKRK